MLKTNSDTVKKFFSSFKLKNFKNSNWLFIIGIVGIFLIFASDFIDNKKTNVIKQDSSSAYNTTYETELEKRLENLIESVDGAGKVKVMITLDGQSENIYAVDENNDTQSNGESYSQNYQSQHVIVNGQGSSEALVETVLAPTVKGVAILCEGAENIYVQKRVVDIAAALLDVPTNRICVTKMRN